MPDASSLIPVLSVSLSAAACVVSILNYRAVTAVAEATQHLARLSKQADIHSDANRRFAELIEAKHDVRNADRPELYYEKFFSLQYDQFCQWTRRFVDDADFDFWMEARRREWIVNSTVHGVTYRDGFEQIASQGWDHKFIRFMRDVHELGVDRARKNLLAMV